LPEGRLVGYHSDATGGRFEWVPNTGTGQRLKLRPLKLNHPLTWPHGGSAATSSHLSVHFKTGTLLFSGILPLEEADALTCRPYALTLSATPGEGEIAKLDWAVSTQEGGRSCAYHWFGEGVAYGVGEEYWLRREGQPPRAFPAGGEGSKRRPALHAGGALIVDAQRGGGVQVLDGSGKLVGELSEHSGWVSCISHSGDAFVLWDASLGAHLYRVEGGQLAPETTALASVKTPDDEDEVWGSCAFSPDGSWVAFTSNRRLGNRVNPLAGVSNPIRTLHAWEPRTGKVELMLPDEFTSAPFVWLPAAGGGG
jgi:hypothetical protein